MRRRHRDRSTRATEAEAPRLIESSPLVEAAPADRAAAARRSVPRSVVAVLLALLVPVTVGILLQPAGAALPAFALAVGVIALLATAWRWPPTALGLGRPRSTWLLGAVPLGLFMVAANVAVGLGLQRVGATAAAGTSAAATLSPLLTDGGLALLLLQAVVLAPIEEELVFRGVLQGALVARLGPVTGIGLTVVAFTVVHGGGAGVFHLVAGVVYGLVALRSGSIWPSVVLHAINNGVGVLLVVRSA